MCAIATIFAGVNGSGKTTFYYNQIEKGFSYGFRINMDEIVSAIGSWRDRSDMIRAGKIACKLRAQCMLRKQSFNQETTLAGSRVLKLFQDLKIRGYIIHLFFIQLQSAELAIQRVQARAQKGGHNVDPMLITKRFYKSRQNLELIKSYVDNLIILDNSTSEGFKIIYSKDVPSDYFS